MPAGRPRKNPEDTARGYNRVQAPKEANAIRLPPWDGKTRGPTLGKQNPEGYDWHPLTLKWWKTWRQSPQAMFCTDTDWQGLFLAAVIHDRIMKGASSTALANLSSELRRREGSVGASIEDRIRLGMTSGTDEETVREADIDAGVRQAVDYAARIGKRLGGANGAA